MSGSDSSSSGSDSSSSGSDSSSSGSDSSGILESGTLESSYFTSDQSSNSTCPVCGNYKPYLGLFEKCDDCNERLSLFDKPDESGFSDFFGYGGRPSP